MSAAIRCEGLRRAFDGRTALDGVRCEAPAGRFTAILGPSGSGKTTLLRIVAGLEAPDAGAVHLGERVVNDPRPVVTARERRIGMVFQSLGLWPHLSAARHVKFVLQARGTPAEVQADRVRELLALVGLPDRGDARPAQLSGGEQQRVALARALAGDPAVLLLDEPFGSLDAALRVRLREAVRDIQRRLQLTTVLVTHDQAEALAVADHLVVMRGGRVEQAGPPADVYRRPATVFVAEFLGGAAVAAATVAAGRVVTPLGEWPADGCPDGPVQVVLRPETLRLAGEGAAGQVAGHTFAGGRFLVAVTLTDGATVTVPHESAPETGAAVHVAATEPPHCIPGAG